MIPTVVRTVQTIMDLETLMAVEESGSEEKHITLLLFSVPTNHF